MRDSALFSDPGDLGRLHRRVTLTAVAAAWVSAAVLVVIWLITSNVDYLWQAVGPLAAATVFTVLALSRRYNAIAVFATATVTVTATYALVGNADTEITAVVSLAVIAILGTLFVERHHLRYLALGVVWMLVTPHLWGDASPFSMGFTMAITFLIGSIIFLMVRQAAVVTNHRNEQMFELAPVGLMEQDWTEAIRIVDELGFADPRRLRTALEADDFLVERIVGSVMVTRTNAEVGAIAGIAPSQMFGRIPLNRVQPTAHANWVPQIVAVVSGAGSFYGEYETTRFTGERIQVGMRAITVERRPEKVRVLVAMDDITEQRQAEEASAQLIRAKDRFIAVVSHELRTPLTAIVGFTSTLADPTMPDDARDEAAQMVHEQATEMTNIVEDLLVATRADIGSITLRPEPLDLGEVAVATIEHYASDEVPVHNRTSVQAFADPTRVRQIMRNLLTNAERYGKSPIRVEVSHDEERIVCEVIDGGPELTPEFQQRMFEPYERADQGEHGLPAAVGLGLAVSRQLARLMGGDLRYLYRDGSVFRLELPVSTASVGLVEASG